MKKQITSLLLSVFLMSCNANINTTNIGNSIKESKSFGIKAVSTIENTDLTYTGNWSQVGGINQSTGTVNNNDASLSYTGNWITYNNGLTTDGNFAYTNNSTPIQLADDTSSNITYLNNGWLTYWKYKYNEIYNSNKKIVTYQETDINKIKYIYGANTQAWSNSMLYWKTFSNINPAYIYSDYQSAQIEIPFNGTNIQIFQYKTVNRGICNIKIYDSNNNIVRDLNVDNYSPTTLLSKTTITGLKNGNYKALIQRTGTKNPSSSNFLFDFVKAEVLPSIEYKFTNDNINYNALKNNNCGKVAVTIDNNPSTTQVIDLYNSSAIFDKVYTKTNLGNGEHTITIDALGEKNNLSSGFRMSVDEFTSNPAVKGTFTGTFLNLKLVKLSNYGKVDLYIDGVWNKEIDLYSPTSQYISENISGLTNTSHTFELVSKNTKNPSSTGTRIAFDGYTTNKASYTFTGTGIKYFANKNNNQGLVDVFIDGNKHGTYTLYSSTLQASQEIVNITGLSNSQHTIDIIPTGIKSWGSTGYGVNVDYLKVDDGNSTSSSKKVVWTEYNHIYVKNADGTGSSIKLSTDSTYNDNAKISADGSKVVWLGSESGVNHAYLRNSDGSGTPNLLSYFGTSDNKDLQISADGSRVVWVSPNNGKFTLIIMDTESLSGTFDSDSIPDSLPQISADASKIVMVSGSDIYSVKLINNDLNNELIKIKLSTNSTNNSNPQISADGSKAVWEGYIGGIKSVFIANTDGTTVTPIELSNTTVNNISPQISADGSKVVWSGQEDYDSTAHIYIRNADGSGTPIQLSTISETNIEPQISKNGTKVIWRGYNSSTAHIYVRNADGSGTPIQLSTSSLNNEFPQISADGSKAVWEVDIGITTSVYVRDTDGSSAPVVLSTANTMKNPKAQISD